MKQVKNSEQLEVRESANLLHLNRVLVLNSLTGWLAPVHGSQSANRTVKKVMSSHGKVLLGTDQCHAPLSASTVPTGLRGTR